MRYFVILLSLFFASPVWAQSITMGDSKVESAGDSGNGNLLVAQQVTLAQAGTLQSLSFDVGIAAGQLILGVYSDNNGKPGTLLTQTATFTPVKGWNTKAPSATPVLQPGTYWLAYAPSSNSLTFFKQNNTGNCSYFVRTFQAMPPSWPTSGVLNCTPTTWSFYATVQPQPPTPPVASAPPVITGTPQVGSVLSASSGLWSDTPTFAFQWFSGSGVVTGATASSYIVQASDIGNALTVAVTATNAAGSGVSLSASTAAVTQPPPPVDYGPDNLGATVVSPTEVDLSWTAVLNAQCYQIFRNGTQIGTSTMPSYQDTTAVHGTAYSYAVSAVISVQSVAVSATP